MTRLIPNIIRLFNESKKENEKTHVEEKSTPFITDPNKNSNEFQKDLNFIDYTKYTIACIDKDNLSYFDYLSPSKDDADFPIYQINEKLVKLVPLNDENIIDTDTSYPVYFRYFFLNHHDCFHTSLSEFSVFLQNSFYQSIYSNEDDLLHHNTNVFINEFGRSTCDKAFVLPSEEFRFISCNSKKKIEFNKFLGFFLISFGAFSVLSSTIV